MPTKRLYQQPIPDGAQLDDLDSLEANLSQQGLLGGGSNTTQISQQPGDHSLRGQYRCRSAEFAEMMARELRELGDSDGFGAIPFYRADAESSDDGYYVVESAVDVGPVQPQEPTIQQFRLSLSEDGTHETRFRAVETTPVQVDHAFGNDTTPRVAVPASATKRRWYDPETGAVAPTADALATRATEHGDVDVYDVVAGAAAVGIVLYSEGSDRGPTLLYELGYSAEGVVDPVVWDDRGHAEKLLASNGDTVRQWQHVFSTSHEYNGRPVLDTGLVRLVVDEPEGVLEAETWDGGAEEWHAVALDWSGTDWQLFDWDIDRIAPVSIESQATFLHPDDGLFALDAVLDRGADAVRWSLPPDEGGPMPSALESVLDPVASAALVDAQPVRELVQRSGVRR